MASAKGIAKGIAAAAVICGIGAGGWIAYKHFGGPVSTKSEKVYVQKVSTLNTVGGANLFATKFAGVIVAQRTRSRTIRKKSSSLSRNAVMQAAMRRFPIQPESSRCKATTPATNTISKQRMSILQSSKSLWKMPMSPRRLTARSRI